MRRSVLRSALTAGSAVALVLGLTAGTATPAAADATITLNGSSATASGSGVTVSGGTVTITAAGTYQLSGTLTNGQVVVDVADGDAVLRLAGVSISNSTGAAIHDQQGDVTVELVAGTTNTLSDASSYVYPAGEDEPDAALFAADDLTITGSGTLTVRGNAYDGIACKDTLTIESGTINVNAADDGIRGKDALLIRGGNITVTSTADGLKSTEDEDPALGQVTITGGTITISAGDDGIHAESDLNVVDGNITVTRSFESLEGTRVIISGGTVNATSTDDGLNAVEAGLNEFSVSQRAVIVVHGGTVVVNSGVDGLDSNGAVAFLGGTTVVNGPTAGGGEGGIDANGAVFFHGGTVMSVATNASTLAPSTTSRQGWVFADLGSSRSSGTVLHLASSNGSGLVGFRAAKSFRTVLYSSNQISSGGSYDVYTGGSVSGTGIGGMYPGSTPSGATRLSTVTAGRYSGMNFGFGSGNWTGEIPPAASGTGSTTRTTTTTTTTRPTTTTTSTTRPTSTSTTTTSTTTTSSAGGGACSATYSVVNQWQGGFQGEVRVTAGSSAISGWRLSWTFADGQTISQAWGGRVTASGSSVTATNESWNGSLGAGASTSLGFIGTWNGTNSVPAVTCTAG